MGKVFAHGLFKICVQLPTFDPMGYIADTITSIGSPINQIAFTTWNYR